MAQRCSEDQEPMRPARTWPGRTAESLGSRISVWLWIDLGETSQGRAGCAHVLGARSGEAGLWEPHHAG